MKIPQYIAALIFTCVITCASFAQDTYVDETGWAISSSVGQNFGPNSPQAALANALAGTIGSTAYTVNSSGSFAPQPSSGSVSGANLTTTVQLSLAQKVGFNLGLVSSDTTVQGQVAKAYFSSWSISWSTSADANGNISIAYKIVTVVNGVVVEKSFTVDAQMNVSQLATYVMPTVTTQPTYSNSGGLYYNGTYYPNYVMAAPAAGPTATQLLYFNGPGGGAYFPSGGTVTYGPLIIMGYE